MINGKDSLESLRLEAMHYDNQAEFDRIRQLVIDTKAKAEAFDKLQSLLDAGYMFNFYKPNIEEYRIRISDSGVTIKERSFPEAINAAYQSIKTKPNE